MRNMLLLKQCVRNALVCWLFIGFLYAEICTASGPPPFILVQPLGTSVQIGGTASFSVVASSGTTMSFQWLFNGSAISGATASTYGISSVQTTNQGVYSVNIVNAGG